MFFRLWELFFYSQCKSSTVNRMELIKFMIRWFLHSRLFPLLHMEVLIDFLHSCDGFWSWRQQLPSAQFNYWERLSIIGYLYFLVRRFGVPHTSHFSSNFLRFYYGDIANMFVFLCWWFFYTSNGYSWLFSISIKQVLYDFPLQLSISLHVFPSINSVLRLLRYLRLFS